jgi:hypothetical protein
MKTIGKLALGAALAGGLALAAAAPADAGVHVGIGIGIPVGGGYGGGNWCYYHPNRCGGPAPAVGVYVGGRGYWSGRGWYGHRAWGRGGWHYR